MNHTVVAVFDEYGDAQSALNALYQEGGFTQADVKLSPAEETSEARQQAIQTSSSAPAGSGSWNIGDFFRSLFGRDQHGEDAGVYSEAVRRGAYMISVDAKTDEQASQAADILQRFKAIDLDQRAAGWRNSGWTGYQADSPLYTADEIQKERDLYGQTAGIATSGSSPDVISAQGSTAGSTEKTQAIPVIEEQMQVGKRSVQRGGVRIFRHVTETPVEESVQLREEHVSVERRPVDQPATAADIAAFKEGTIEVRETVEEPVIAKTARVVEEVEIGKEVTERTEHVTDTLRRTDVEVEPLAGQTASAGSVAGGTAGEDAFRQHWQTAYGSGGGRYEDYSSAYRYGASLAGHQQYQGYRWEELEPHVKSDWEATHAGSPWEKTKQAVRYGWEKMTAR